MEILDQWMARARNRRVAVIGWEVEYCGRCHIRLGVSVGGERSPLVCFGQGNGSGW